MYTCDPEESDLLLIVKMDAWSAQGGHAETESVGRIVMEHTSAGLRMNLYQVLAVCIHLHLSVFSGYVSFGCEN